MEGAAGFFKDAFHEYIVRGNEAAVNPEKTGTKAGALYELMVPAGGLATVRWRLSKGDIAAGQTLCGFRWDFRAAPAGGG